MKKICILASGGGSNTENIINYFQDNESIQIAIVASNKKHARVLNRAKKHNIESFHFTQDQLTSGILLEKLLLIRVDFIVLAGFLLKIPQLIISKFHNKIINIHPSLLPKYKGLNTHKKAIENNDKYAGCSVHFVTAKIDSGKIIMQKKVRIKKNDTIYSLSRKVLKKEHLLYPAAIKKIYN